MTGGYNARIVDNEYKMKKIYENKNERAKCKDQECEKCKYNNICENNESGSD